MGRSLSRIYLDASCIIYLIEAADPFHAAVVARLAHHRADPSASVVTSRLSRLECRTRPLRERNLDVLEAYDAFFSEDQLVLAEVGGARLPHWRLSACPMRRHRGGNRHGVRKSGTACGGFSFPGTAVADAGADYPVAQAALAGARAPTAPTTCPWPACARAASRVAMSAQRPTKRVRPCAGETSRRVVAVPVPASRCTRIGALVL